MAVSNPEDAHHPAGALRVPRAQDRLHRGGARFRYLGHGSCALRCIPLFVALAIAVGGDQAAGASRSETSRVASMVLPLEEMPPGFVQTVSRSWTPRELSRQGTWTLKQLRQWGYIVGYEAEFTHDLTGPSPMQISSDAGAYRTAAGARRSLRANAAASRRGLWRPLELTTKIGDEALLSTLVTTLRGGIARVFFLVWRHGRYKGSITLSGAEGQVVVSTAVSLAKTQELRMRRALE